MSNQEKINRLLYRLDNLERGFCCKVNCCLGISSTGDENLFLNQQGNWVEAGGSSTNCWNLTGNAGTDSNINFIGTTDKTDIIFKRDNSFAGKISSGATSFGLNSNNVSTTATTAIGSGALQQATGENNTSLGENAGGSLITGNDNVFIGSNADSTSDTVTNAIALGSHATATSNQFAIPDTVTTIKFKGLTYTLPTSLPAGDAVLHCDASGILTWV